MDLEDIIIKGLKKSYRTLAKPHFDNPTCELDRQKANDLIYNLLTTDKPCMISRFGTGEIGIVNNYLTSHSKRALWKRCIDYIIGNTGLPW